MFYVVIVVLPYMCGRFTITFTANEIETEFQISVPKFMKNYNVAPTQDVVAVLNNDEKNAVMVQWGLIPSWAKDKRIGSTIINARAETITEKPAFRSLVHKRRCIIIADSFYEWKRHSKIPYRIMLNTKKAFAFAGLWDTWNDITTCTIITCSANALMKPIHDRMPVILQDWQSWLKDGTLNLLQPYPPDKMIAYHVSDSVNSWKNNYAGIINAV